MSIKKLFHQISLIVLLVFVSFVIFSCCNSKESAKPTTEPTFDHTIATKVYSELQKTTHYVQQTKKVFLNMVFRHTHNTRLWY